MTLPLVKVCGITRRVDLEVCDAAGVDAVGINLWSGSKRGLSVDEAAVLLEGVSGAQRVGVFVDHAPHAAVGVARDDGIADAQRAALHQHGGHRAATAVQVRLDRHALSLHVRVGPQGRPVGCFQKAGSPRPIAISA